MEVSRITRLHGNVDTERVSLRINLICFSRIIKLFKDLPRSDTPSIIFDRYVSGRVVVGLEEVVACEMGGEIGSDEL